MQIGICDVRNHLTDEDYNLKQPDVLLREFAPQWTIVHICAGEQKPDAIERDIDYVRMIWEVYGIHTVVDLQTEDEGGQMEHRYPWWRDSVRRLVERLTPVVQHWQFWSEAHCHVVGKGWTHAKYAEALGVTSKAIREVNPDAKVLLAGHCERWITTWYEGVMAHGAAQHFDMNCLHSYFHAPRDWPHIESTGNAAFAKFAELCAAAGVEEHPTCVTEFGMATHPGWDDADDSMDLKSWVYPFVRTLSQGHVAEYVNLMLQFLESHGTEFFLWLAWHDFETADNHWSTRTGLLNKAGQPKTPLYEMMREWSHKGRA